jgi:hypothetical protein
MTRITIVLAILVEQGPTSQLKSDHVNYSSLELVGAAFIDA